MSRPRPRAARAARRARRSPSVGVMVMRFRDGGSRRSTRTRRRVRRLGYTPEEWLATPLYGTIVAAEHRERVRAAVRAASPPASRRPPALELTAGPHATATRCAPRSRVGRVEIAASALARARRARHGHRAAAADVAARGRSARARRCARRGVRARDEQPADLGAAQPALAAQAASLANLTDQRTGERAALPRRHHDRRRADREQRARAADARDAQRDADRSISPRWCPPRSGSPRRRSSRART